MQKKYCKQITLRLTPEDEELLTKLKETTGKKTVNKAVLFAVKRFVHVSRDIEDLNKEIDTLNKSAINILRVLRGV